MAVLAKKLNIQKSGNSAVACDIYTTTTEAGSDYVRVTVDGTNGYIAVGDTTHGKATAGRVTKSGTTKAILSSANIPYNKTTYTTAGVSTFRVPAGVTRVKVTLAGGGGGGGNNLTYWSSWKEAKDYKSGYITNYGGTGGKGGLYVSTLTVSENTDYSITVGAGGAALKNGGDSKFGSLATATGGKAGTSAYSYTSGSGESATTKYANGANGANGTPAGEGGAGGSSGGGAGSKGWVYVEYGEGIN